MRCWQGLYTCAGPRTCAHGRMGSKGHFQQVRSAERMCSSPTGSLPEDAQVFAEWEVDLVKMDWCGTKGMIPKAVSMQIATIKLVMPFSCVKL
eukprot:1343035-Amphidinium_carterae.1